MGVGFGQGESGIAKEERMGRKGKEAYVASTDMLLRFDIVVHNL